MEATVVKCSLLFHGVSFALWHVKPTKLILHWGWGGGHSTAVALALLAQQPRVWSLPLPIIWLKYWALCSKSAAWMVSGTQTQKNIEDVTNFELIGFFFFPSSLTILMKNQIFFCLTSSWKCFASDPQRNYRSNNVDCVCCSMMLTHSIR